MLFKITPYGYIGAIAAIGSSGDFCNENRGILARISFPGLDGFPEGLKRQPDRLKSCDRLSKMEEILLKFRKINGTYTYFSILTNLPFYG
ncbi:MAG: hypothetical protein D6680_16200 [Cyanobacteria bacterium J007]|nr:MAG: hypothetical protein D6680_16200 [Cyanobacteria bacterium J007]